MVNKSVQDLSGDQQKKRSLTSLKNLNKSDDTLQTNGDKDDASEYPVIYYRGENMKKTISTRLSLRPSEQAQIKDTSYHMTPHDHIAYRFECIRLLGGGSFGNVILAFDHKKKMDCAVKVIRRDPRFTAQAKKEVEILKALQKANPHPNDPSSNFPIVEMIENFMFREHMCLTFELLGCSLYDLIKDKKNEGLPRDRVRRLMASVLDGLSYVWHAKIIHCDLKPENVLLVSHSTGGGPDDIRDHVKIIDFGSSCFVGEQCYPYIQSRFYRAPEVILRLEYNQPIDVWSFGCLVFEMIRGYPIFPGEDEFDQMACMMEKLGMPPSSMIVNSRVLSRYFSEIDNGKKYYNPVDKKALLKFVPKYCTTRLNPDGTNELQPTISRRTRQPRKQPGAIPVTRALVSKITSVSGKYIDYAATQTEEVDNGHVVKLIEACLRWIPEKRVTPDQAKLFSWFNYNANQAPASLTPPTVNPKISALNRRVNENNRGPLHTEVYAKLGRTVTNGVPGQLHQLSSVVTAATDRKPRPSSPQQSNVPRNGINQKISSVSQNVRSTQAKYFYVDPDSLGKISSTSSISSGEDKQEERILYPRIHKPPSPPVISIKKESQPVLGGPEKKVSDVSAPSVDSSFEEDGSHPVDGLRYLKNERHAQNFEHLRRRKQSVGAKRFTEPLGTDAEAKGDSLHSTRNFSSSRPVVSSPSGDEDLQKSGRHNPRSFDTNSQWDMSVVGRQDKALPNSYVSSVGRGLRRHACHSEVVPLDKRIVLKSESERSRPRLPWSSPEDARCKAKMTTSDNYPGRYPKELDIPMDNSHAGNSAITFIRSMLPAQVTTRTSKDTFSASAAVGKDVRKFRQPHVRTEDSRSSDSYHIRPAFQRLQNGRVNDEVENAESSFEIVKRLRQPHAVLKPSTLEGL